MFSYLKLKCRSNYSVGWLLKLIAHCIVSVRAELGHPLLPLVDSAIDWHCFKSPDEIDAIGVSNSLLHHFWALPLANGFLVDPPFLLVDVVDDFRGVVIYTRVSCGFCDSQARVMNEVDELRALLILYQGILLRHFDVKSLMIVSINQYH